MARRGSNLFVVRLAADCGISAGMIPRRPGSGSSGSDTGRQLWRLSGMGIELASHILAGVLLGWLLDKLFKTAPVWLVVGSITGLVVGMAEFIRSALKAQREAGEKHRRRKTGAAAPPESESATGERDHQSPRNSHVGNH